MLKPIVALYKPAIPPNTGNIGRICVATKSILVLIGKIPFRLDDASLRRAGLDYWKYLEFYHVKRWKIFYQEFVQKEKRRLIGFSKEGKSYLWDFSFEEGDILLFGNEKFGLPPFLLKRLPYSVRIPMWGEVRSLNLSNAVAISLYEYMRQHVKRKKIPLEREIPYIRTYYKKPSGHTYR